MNAKATVIKADKSKKSYPYFGYYPEFETIVLFTKKNTGVCIAPGDDELFIGEYASNWNEEEFVQFVGKVTVECK